MSVEFSAKISMLRKEKGVTQRQAAQELHISQALLSHYEKGIRECSLDFVKKAAQYYGVTADFLLGLTESKRGFGDIYVLDTLDSDTELSPKSIVRAQIYYSEKAAAAGDEALNYFTDYFSAALKQYTDSLSDNKMQIRLNAICMQMLLDSKPNLRMKTPNPSVAANTVLIHAQELMKDTVSSLTGG